MTSTMKNWLQAQARLAFRRKDAALSPAEQALREWGIEYKKRRKGAFVVRSLDISGKNLTALPDLSCVIVKGDFNCSGNRLTTLKGAPQQVDGGFFCQDNLLTTLEGTPPRVGGDFRCDNNRLEMLDGPQWAVGGSFNCDNNLLRSLLFAPPSVGRHFSCNNNRLTTLKGAPGTVPGSFSCDGNSLASLDGAPREVGQGLTCFHNPLTSLWGMPESFIVIQCDFDDFRFRSQIPADLRLSPEAQARRAAEMMRAASGAEALRNKPKGFNL